MRVAIVLDQSVLLSHHGVRRYSLSLAAALANHGTVDVLRLDFDPQSKRSRYTRVPDEHVHDHDSGFKGTRLVGASRTEILEAVRKLGNEPSAQPAPALGAQGGFEESRKEYDLVILSAPWVYFKGISLPKGKVTMCIVLDAIPNLYSFRFPTDSKLRHFANQHLVAFEDFSEHYNGLLAISAQSKEQCTDILLGDGAKISVLPPFLPSGFEEVARASRPPPKGNTLVLAAPFDRRKGLLDMPMLINESGVESLKVFGNIRCSVEDVSAFFEALHIEDVEWWLDVDFEKQVELYSSAKALLFPSFNEGLGLPVLEAYACGTAVFARDIRPVNELTLKEGILDFDAPDPAKPIRDYFTRTHEPKRFKDYALSRWSSDVVAEFLSNL